MSNSTCACCKHLVSWMAFEDHTKRGAARRCKACVNGPNSCLFWHREAPSPSAPKPTAEEERQERLETVRVTMGPPPQQTSETRKRRQRHRTQPRKRSKKVNHTK
ncbi:hypothetical protein PHMEG_00038932 [Phytophthora megakarya]|uniref:Uncharacterized protein n=1 Tax=Phytophthora megakarya TaxID=4795 RepID=A0A225UGS5_9STRA|nr:hypothetical protein PHMEG_00038932 [Phytophthora megakarya]